MRVLFVLFLCLLVYSQTGVVRVSRSVAQAHLVKKVEPGGDWLGDARNVQGEVEFEAVIDKRGCVVKLQLVHGHPLLVGRAEEAVLQYRYRPFVFKKVPGTVSTDIVVPFTSPKAN
jgi:hypothetical protein